MNDVSDESLMSINLFHGSAGGLSAFLVCVTFILYFIIIPRNRSSVDNCHVSLMAFGLKKLLSLEFRSSTWNVFTCVYTDVGCFIAASLTVVSFNPHTVIR